MYSINYIENKSQIYIYYNNSKILQESFIYKTNELTSINNYTNTCKYINKYGVVCENKCIMSPFKLRMYFCEHHIKNNIGHIIKSNKTIEHFSKQENQIISLFLNKLHLSRINHEKLKIANIFYKLYNYLLVNIDYLLMSQIIVLRFHNMLFQAFQNYMIYDFTTYKINNKRLKQFHYDSIIKFNKNKKKEISKTLLSLSETSDNYIGKVFCNSQIAEIRIFDIIETFI